MTTSTENVGIVTNRAGTPLHIRSIVVNLDQEVHDVVSDEAGYQAMHAVKLPIGFEGTATWFVRPVKGTTMVVLTPVPFDEPAEHSHKTAEPPIASRGSALHSATDRSAWLVLAGQPADETLAAVHIRVDR
jgi:hypothetical protein